MIAFFHNQIDLATFCFVIVGSLLAFLWFNIPPARFFMSETGIMALTMTLAVVAFLTQSLLPIIAFLWSSHLFKFSSAFVQKFRMARKYFGLLHPSSFSSSRLASHKVVMRYWVIGVICAMLGLVLALLG